jgi:hypothetical protein
MQWQRCLDGFVNDQHLRDLRVVPERPFMRHRRALAEEQVLPPVRRRLDSHNLKQGRLDPDAYLLQHLARTCLLPRLPEHLVASRQCEPALALARQGAADHEKAASQGHKHDHDGGGVSVQGQGLATGQRGRNIG